MAHHDDVVSLRQMLDHAREASDPVKQRVRAGLGQGRVLSLALVQLCQILGEAASRVSDPRRQQPPEVPWPQIIALRNRLIHGYDTIHLDILWQILTGDVPPLIVALENIVSPQNPGAAAQFPRRTTAGASMSQHDLFFQLLKRLPTQFQPYG